MKKTNERLVQEVCPPTLVSKFTADMREFDLESLRLNHYVQFVLDHYQWLGADEDERDERACHLENLGYLLRRTLNATKSIYEERGQVIRDEHCDWAEASIKNIDDHINRLEQFVEEAENLLLWALDGHATESQLRLIKGFQEYTLWMHQLAKDEELMGRMSEKCRAMNLHHGFGMFGVGIEDFRQQSFAVINALFLLTVPSHVGCQDADFAPLFDNSLNVFRESQYCKDDLARLEEEMNTRFDAQHIDSFDAKMDDVKRTWWEPLKKNIGKMLKDKWGITYTNTLGAEHKGRLGRQLYERLNGVRIAKNDSSPMEKMSNNDLCRYLAMEAELQFFAKKIEEYRNLANDPIPPDEYFALHVRRSLAHDAIEKTIFQKGEDKRTLLYAQSHWMAIHKVFEYHGMCLGSLNDFCNVMSRWFKLAPRSCEYDSLKNVKVEVVKTKPYTEWSAADRACIPYRRIALTLAKYLREAGVIS